MNLRQNKKAFTLIELSVVLVIIGIVLVGFLQGSVLLLRRNREAATKQKLDTIEKSLTSYLLINGNLPCPARLDLKEGASGFGEMGDCSGTDGTFVYDTHFVYGTIPTTTLNLINTMMRDEWGNKFSYIVHKDYTSQGGGFKNMNPASTAITVYTEGTTAELTNRAVYALISHGNNRLGAWGYDSGVQGGSDGISTEEGKNISKESFDGTVVYAKYAEDFDDIMRYRTKNQLIMDADWEEIGCYIDATIRNENKPDSTCYDDGAEPSPEYLSYYAEHEWAYDNPASDSECCIAKCYKYGRLGYYLKGLACK
jgi:prepilin-type N-terminal cleavage/methylation domain-containing protein